MSGTLILGGGFGGLSAAATLREELGPDHEITLVDRAERFSMGLRKLWELVGISTIEAGSRSRDNLSTPGVRVIRNEITAIRPEERSADVGGETITADHLVLALGAVSRPDLIPGLAENAHDVWSVAGVPAAAEDLRAFDGGRIMILIAGAPYPCPPAPYECAFHLDEHLANRGLRGRSEIEIASVQPILMPNAGKDGSAWMAGHLERRGIAARAGRKVVTVEPGAVVFEDEVREVDLLLAVPPHRASPVLADAGLTNDKGWVPVDGRSLRTPHDGVFAIGDSVHITLANGLPFPKAGVMAERQGEHVARAIAADLRRSAPPAPFDGTGFCFIEMGADEAAMFTGSFYDEPAPTLTMDEPGAEHAEEKRAFESERLAAWFN